ncbi:diguanylate cyclase, partial [Stenotrophomonas sp. GbtcB23]|uniref:GGDEF domain-containing protein n=1 Tax=Stenotrophomonas sp. GbtcB23 TaxID=2824768 RepID=UPI001C303078
FRRLDAAHDEETVSCVLKAIASELDASCVGGRHLLARLGAEEFGLLLVGLDGAAAMDFCERLRLQVAALRFEAGAPDFSVTVSVGLAKVR